MLLEYSQALESAIAKVLANNAIKKITWSLFTTSLKKIKLMHWIKCKSNLEIKSYMYCS